MNYCSRIVTTSHFAFIFLQQAIIIRLVIDYYLAILWRFLVLSTCKIRMTRDNYLPSCFLTGASSLIVDFVDIIPCVPCISFCCCCCCCWFALSSICSCPQPHTESLSVPVSATVQLNTNTSCLEHPRVCLFHSRFGVFIGECRVKARGVWPKTHQQNWKNCEKRSVRALLPIQIFTRSDKRSGTDIEWVLQGEQQQPSKPYYTYLTSSAKPSPT